MLKSALSLRDQQTAMPNGMMDIIIEPNITLRVQVAINKVYLSCSLAQSKI